MRHFRSWSLLAFAAPAFAQTFIVDVNNGPGTNFTSLATATATVPSGSVLLVRSGNYLPFIVAGKSMKILADPGVIVHPPNVTPPSFTITGLQAQQSVVLHGLGVGQGYPTGSTAVVCSNCQGSILIEGLQLVPGHKGLIQATNCDRLLIRDHPLSSGWVPCVFTNSHAVLENGRFGAGAILPGFIAGHGIVQNGGTLQIANCTVVGGISLVGGAANAIEMQGGDLRLLGGSVLQPGFGTISFAIGGTGNVRVDPSAVLGAPGAAPTVTVTTREMPRLVSTFAAPTAQAMLAGPSGQLGAIGVALPGPRVAVPGLDDAIWLDRATFATMAVGVFAPGNPIVASITWGGGVVPAVRAVWQGITFDPAGGFQVSNPSFVILP